MPGTMVGRDVGGRSVSKVERKRPVESIIDDVVWLIVGVIAVLLALRFVLLLLGANQNAGFTEFIYSITTPFMAPFVAVFGKAQFDRAVFDWSNLLAIVIYLLIGWLLTALVAAITPRASYEAVESETSSTRAEDKVVEKHDAGAGDDEQGQDR